MNKTEIVIDGVTYIRKDWITLKELKSIEKKSIMERVKTFEDALEVSGEWVNDTIPFLNPKTDDQKALNEISKLFVICRVLNEGWVPDWTNSSEGKYYPYFQFSSGFGFSRTTYDSRGTATSVGSRLCFKSKELAEYAGKQFDAIYRDFLGQ